MSLQSQHSGAEVVRLRQVNVTKGYIEKNQALKRECEALGMVAHTFSSSIQEVEAGSP